MAEWLRRLTRNQMRSSRVGSNSTRSGNSFRDGLTELCSCHKGPPHPQRKLGNAGHCCHGSVSRAQCHAVLPFLEVCCSSCGKAMAGTSINKYHLCHQQVQLVVGPKQHQLNRQPCHIRTCATTALVQTAYLGPSRQSVPSRPFGIATQCCGRDKVMPEWGPAHTLYGALQVQSKETDTRPQWYTPDLTSPAQQLSPVALFTSTKEKLTTR